MDQPNWVTTVTKEMGLTHRDFFRTLDPLLQDTPHVRAGSVISFQRGERTIEIQLSPETERVLSPTVRLPVTVVVIRFFDCSQSEVDAFIQDFNRRFLRGGG